MGLVDYGSSDESNDEDNDNKEESKEQSKKLSSGAEQNKLKSDAEAADGGRVLFSSLPKPKGPLILDGNDNSLKNMLLKNTPKSSEAGKKESVKIGIPSLSEFEKVGASETNTKQIQASSKKGAGLFSLLPPPKNLSVKTTNRQLLPQVIQNQMNKPKAQTMKTEKKVEIPSTVGVNDNAADDDEEDAVAINSYFGDGVADTTYYDPNAYNDLSYVYPQNMNNDCLPTTAYETDPGQSYVNAHNVYEPLNNDLPSECDNMPSKSETLELDEKALHILCGGKRKRTQMPVNIIDLSSEEIMPDSKEWLLKQFTEEKKVRRPSHKKHEGPSLQSRRKHQITYLAYQAKEQELELQNQWAANRMSRRQTQSKYGF